MNISLRISNEWGTTRIRLFKDRTRADSYKTFACTVSVGEHRYRAEIPAEDLQDILLFVKSATISPASNSVPFLPGSYVLRISDCEWGGASATYRWSVCTDNGWGALHELVGMLRQLGSSISGCYL